MIKKSLLFKKQFYTINRDTQKLIISKIIIYLVSFSMPFFAIYSYSYNYSLFYLDVATMFIGFGLIYYINKRKNIATITHLISLFGFVLISGAIYFEKVTHNSILWTLLYPFLSITLLGYKKGFLASLALYSVVLIMVFNFGEDIQSIEYTRYIIIALIILILIFIYEYIINNFISLLHRDKIKKKKLIKELKISKEKLKLLSITDYLTKLYNRRYFIEASKHILNIHIRDKNDLCLIMIDIDNFKNINDNFGHEIGDKVIIALSNILKDKVRNSDIIARWGGEEFVVLLPKTNINGAYNIANIIKKSIIEYRYTKNGIKISFTVSMGISTNKKTKDDNINNIIHNADNAMYISKKTGKNKITISDVDD